LTHDTFDALSRSALSARTLGDEQVDLSHASRAVEIAVLDATRDGINLSVWCDHCQRLHHHGVCSGDPRCPATQTRGRNACICPPGTGNGHRVAHCADPASPYYETGYVLHEVTR